MKADRRLCGGWRCWRCSREWKLEQAGVDCGCWRRLEVLEEAGDAGRSGGWTRLEVLEEAGGSGGCEI